MAGKERNEEKGGFRYGGGHSFSSRFLEEKKKDRERELQEERVGLRKGIRERANLWELERKNKMEES